MTTREEMRSLAEEIVGSYADRVASIAELRKTVRMDLREWRRYLKELLDSRIVTGRQMRVHLARNVVDREREVGHLLKGFGTELKKISNVNSDTSKKLKAGLAKSATTLEHEVGAMRSSLRQDHTAMSKQLKADLAKGVTTLEHEVGAMLKGFSAEIKEVRSDLAGARDEWQVLSATLQAQRLVPAVEVKPSIKKVAEEKAAALGDRVFEYLANHPDGTKLVELEQEFGVARIQMARLLKELMDENKVKKQDMLYFAI